ncbi:MAG: glutamine-hydrolyzing carbamoyl-phosphate synthase small subunit [Solirubrobacterales bacterium]|nr:glutamine-hydrolyzing carbamoyl-phosphate synthase small subunit [Solirubrobacterales bacterium]
MSPRDAYVLLQDGARFEGELCGAARHAVGEVVFTTGMSGYQESLTDPSFAGQLITFTYPHIGNYGVSAAAMESERPWAAAAIMREAVNREDAPSAERGWLDWLADCDVPAITGVDTRALVRHIREAGSMEGGLFPGSIPETQARELIEREPPMLGRDLTALVSPPEVSTLGEGSGPRVAVLDTGVKGSIVRNLLARGARVELHPAASTPAQLLAHDPDAVLLANGPGDPAALDHIAATVRALVGRRPVWGICLGHQLLCRALGLETFKLPFGHRGANHPVKNLHTGRVEITSQNHGFAVVAPGGAHTLEPGRPARFDTDFGEAELSHVNLYDRTAEGLRLLEVPAASVQYHPEAGPGPRDSLHLFDRFLEGVGRGASG